MVRMYLVEIETPSEAEVHRLRKMSYAEYLESPWWKERRRLQLEFSRGRCQVCDGSDSPGVHHRTYDRVGCERLADLVVLCGRCHGLFHDVLPDPPVCEEPIIEEKADVQAIRLVSEGCIEWLKAQGRGADVALVMGLRMEAEDLGVEPGDELAWLERMGATDDVAKVLHVRLDYARAKKGA